LRLQSREASSWGTFFLLTAWSTEILPSGWKKIPDPRVTAAAIEQRLPGGPSASTLLPAIRERQRLIAVLHGSDSFV
jgi:hypothetical protein